METADLTGVLQDMGVILSPTETAFLIKVGAAQNLSHRYAPEPREGNAHVLCTAVCVFFLCCSEMGTVVARAVLTDRATRFRCGFRIFYEYVVLVCLRN